MKLISDKELLETWEDAFDNPVYFDRKPTVDDYILVRLRAVAQAQMESDETRIQNIEA